MPETLHCLFIAADSKNKLPLVINFTKAYEVEFPSNTSVQITKNADPYVAAGLKEAGVAGIVVLYGINGAGKTAAMIDVANAFGDNPHARTAGGLIERDGKLFLRKGKALKNYVPTGGLLLSTLAEDNLQCLSLFYTSSPFDNGRLNRLRQNRLAFDVSPRYGERNAFDGLSLLEIRSALKMPFVDQGEISMRLRIGTVSNSLVAVTNSLGISGGPDTPIVRSAINAAARQLPQHEHMQLRRWLSLFVAVHAREERAFPASFVKLMWRFPDTAAPLEDLYALWKAVILGCRRCMDMHEMLQVMELLQLLSEPGLAKPLSQKYSPDALDKLIKQELHGHREGMRQCIDLGLLEFSMSKLSAGQMAYATLFSSLYGGLQRAGRVGGNHPVLILLDEGEMFLHPQWQREYIAKLLEFAKEVPRLSGRLYFVLATHSLIVAADAPPDSLVDVATGKRENGFGLGPRSTLTDIYKVSVFHGEYSESEFDRIDDFLKKPTAHAYDAVKDIARALADRHSGDYLECQIDEAMQRSGE